MNRASLIVPRTSSQHDRTATDQKARQLVLGAYREGCHEDASTSFEAALSIYRSRYPHISKAVAGHAVAYILATEGV